MDVAASELYENGSYHFKGEHQNRDLQSMINYYSTLISDYPILSIEDGLAEDDWSGWKALTQHIGDRVQLVGDDLFVTNPSILGKGISDGVGNAILIKLNQIGSVSETLDAIKLAQDNGYKVIVSHRLVKVRIHLLRIYQLRRCRQIKTGSLCRSERTCKYNQLLRIEQFGTSALPFLVKVFLNVMKTR